VEAKLLLVELLGCRYFIARSSLYKRITVHVRLLLDW